MAMDEPTLAIGELARRSGVSVRTLRLYERNGLISATRAGNGRRHFPTSALARLRLVRALKRIGLTLREIRAALTADKIDLAGVIAAQLNVLDRRKDELRWSTAVLSAALFELEGNGQLSADALCQLNAAADAVRIEPRDDIVDRYYSPDQLVRLRARAPDAETMRAAQAEWQNLVACIEKLAAEAADITSAEAQAAAERWSAIMQAFTRGDADIAESLRRQAEDAYAIPGNDTRPPASPSSLSKRGWQFISGAVDVNAAR